jgi:hypothetical protein
MQPTAYIVAEYSNHDGMRVRGLFYDDKPAACLLALNLYQRQKLAFGVIADFVVMAWLDKQFEENSRGERDHVIYSAATEYADRMENVQEWTPPPNFQPLLK